MASRFGQKKQIFSPVTAHDAWTDLGSRYERFESQPPTDDKGDHAKLNFRARQAFRTVQRAINAEADAHTSTGSGRRTRTSLPSLDQRRYEKCWRGQALRVLEKHRAAETPAQVIHLARLEGERRAA